MAKITFINKTDKTQVFQKHSYGFMTIKPGETVDLYLDYTKDITTKAFIKSFYSSYESIFDIIYSFDEDVSKPYLEFSSDDDFTLSVSNPGWDGILEYSIDEGITWTEWDGSELSGTATQPIYLRGTGNTVITGSSGNLWTFTGKYCTGNIENLLDYQTVANGQHPTMADKCYYSMFNDCKSLVQAPELPATTLANECYSRMFKGCTFAQAPELPATELAGNCYSCMFQGCKSLTIPPELPATELAGNCYDMMFQGCKSLTIAPELPATELADSCYYSMFTGCSSLTQAPELPATTLVNACYYSMFGGCTSLTIPPELPATTLVSNCYFNMFSGCTSLKLSENQTEEYPYAYRIPTTGTGTTAGNALSNMFKNTGGTFTGTPEINTTYYTDHELV